MHVASDRLFWGRPMLTSGRRPADMIMMMMMKYIFTRYYRFINRPLARSASKKTGYCFPKKFVIAPFAPPFPITGENNITVIILF